MPWYYEADRQQRGPVTDEEFANLVNTGAVRAETLVWREGWTDWKSYSQALAEGATSSGAANPGAAAGEDTAVCAISGRRLAKRDMLEFEGRWVSAEHKEEFFQRLREGVAAPTEVVYATFGQRFAAKIIDGVILWVIGTVITLGVGTVMGMALASQIADSDAAAGVFIVIQVVAQLASIGAGICYSIFFIRKYDATPGKRMLKLKVLRADGSRLTKGRIVGRYFAEMVSSLILGIGYLMVAFDKEQRRALHDKMCDTRVVKI